MTPTRRRRLARIVTSLCVAGFLVACQLQPNERFVYHITCYSGGKIVQEFDRSLGYSLTYSEGIWDADAGCFYSLARRAAR